jgi:acetate kinase
VRAATVSGLRFLGVEIDSELNAQVAGDVDISSASAAVPTLVVKAHEDIEVAREVRKVLSVSPPSPL